MIVTANDAHADMLRSMRNNGWHREIRDKAVSDSILREYPNIDSRFLFPYIGHNFKPTDVGAALVLGQLEKLDERIAKRALVVRAIHKALEPYASYIHPYGPTPGAEHSHFAFPVVVRKEAPFAKQDLVKHLTDRNVANRPIIAGNIVEQPFLKDFTYRALDLPNSDLVLKNGFFIGCHERLEAEALEYIETVFRGFLVDRGLLA